MKPLYLFTIFILLLNTPQKINSKDHVNVSIGLFSEEAITENEYLEYKFGFSKFVTVKVVKELDNYIVSIYEECGEPNKKLVIKDSDILDWAFEKMASQFEKTNYIIDESYSPAVTELTFVNKYNGINLCVTSRMDIIGDDVFNKNLNKLKSYLVNIWYSEIFYHNNKLNDGDK